MTDLVMGYHAVEFKIDDVPIGLEANINSLSMGNELKPVHTVSRAFPRGIRLGGFKGLLSVSFIPSWNGLIYSNLKDFVENNHVLTLSGYDYSSYASTGVYDIIGLRLLSAVLTKMSVSVRVGESVSMTTEFMFKEYEQFTPSDITRLDVPIVVSGFFNTTIQGFNVNGQVQGFTLNINSGRRPVYNVANRYPLGFAYGKFTYELTVDVLLNKNDLDMSASMLSSLAAQSATTQAVPEKIQSINISFGAKANDTVNNYSFSLQNAYLDRVEVYVETNEFVRASMTFIGTLVE